MAGAWWWMAGACRGFGAPDGYLLPWRVWEPRRHQHEPLWEASRGRPGRTLPKRKNASRRSAAAIFGMEPDTQSNNVMHRKKRDRRQLQQKMSSRSSFGLRKANLGSKNVSHSSTQKASFAKVDVSSSRRNAHFFYTCMNISMASLRRDFLLGRGGSKCTSQQNKTMRR